MEQKMESKQIVWNDDIYTTKMQITKFCRICTQLKKFLRNFLKNLKK